MEKEPYMSEDRSTEKAGEPTHTPESFETQQEAIAALREQLAQANEWDRENRRIIAALTQRIPEIEPPAQGVPSEPPGSPTEATEQPGRVGPQTEIESHQEGAEPVSWWRRVFGG